MLFSVWSMKRILCSVLIKEEEEEYGYIRITIFQFHFSQIKIQETEAFEQEYVV